MEFNNERKMQGGVKLSNRLVVVQLWRTTRARDIAAPRARGMLH